MMTSPRKEARRIVLINHTSPARGDVSALRMSRLAEALSRRGDAALLMTTSGGIDGDAVPLSQVEERIRDRPSGTVVHLACAPVPTPVYERARTGALPSPLRQAVLAWGYAAHGGVFPDWRLGARPYLPIIADAFRPDAIIGTFGNTDTWSIAAELARHAKSPWIADLKDNWSAFVPRFFATSAPRRFADMAHMTVYSEAHRTEADKWFPAPKTVVYSGFDHIAPPAQTSYDGTRVTLVGSVYDDEKVALLIRALDTWRRNAGLDTVTLAYAGADGARVAAILERLALPMTFIDHGRLAPDALGTALASSAANAYVVHPRSLFQQKPLELLAAGRPVIAVPGENAEVERLSGEIGGRLVCGADPTTLATGLADALAAPSPEIRADVLDRFTWDAQAAVMEQVIDRVLEARR